MKRLVIVGATGMVGGYALRYALEQPHVGHVTSIGRRNLDLPHSKLTQVLHPDFADCSALAETLRGQDLSLIHIYDPQHAGAHSGAGGRACERHA